LLSDTKIAIQQRYLGETKLKVVVLLSRVERDKTLGEIAIPNFQETKLKIVVLLSRVERDKTLGEIVNSQLVSQKQVLS
jgi:hypothetical protein